jgi:hypothetical protein
MSHTLRQHRTLHEVNHRAQLARDNEGMTVEERQKLSGGVDFLLGGLLALLVLVLIVFSAPECKEYSAGASSCARRL